MNFGRKQEILTSQYLANGMGKLGIILDEIDFEYIPFKEFYSDPPKELVKFLKIAKPVLNMDKAILAGGSLVRAALGAPMTGDFDVFSCDNYMDISTQMMISCAPKKINTAIATDGYAPSFTFDALKIQLVHYILSYHQDWRLPPKLSPTLVLRSFDLYNSMIATDGETVIIHKKALEALNQRKIILNHDMLEMSDSKLHWRIHKYSSWGLAFPDEYKKSTNVWGRIRYHYSQVLNWVSNWLVRSSP
jgi:hypothetical protein